MGLVDFFSKRNGGKRYSSNTNFRNQFSSSEEESDDEDSQSAFLRSRDKKRNTKTSKQRRRSKKYRRKSTKRPAEIRFDSDDDHAGGPFGDDSNNEDATAALLSHEAEVLTREELFDLPARDLRKKCKALRINTSNVFEKKDLVSLLHNHYRTNNRQQQQSRKDEVSNVAFATHGNYLGDTMTTLPGSNGNNTIASNRIGVVNSNVAPTDDESEQMVEILQEIIPYFNQGDANIDEIVKDTIERLPPDNLENRDKEGNSLLLICCQSGAYELVPLLLSKGSDPNAINNYGETGLHFTSYSDTYSPETAKILVQNGANAEMKEMRFGCTALHYAASMGDAELCRILLDGGASPLTLDKNRCDPIGYATQSKKQACISLLTTSSSRWMASASKIANLHATADDDRGYESDWQQLIDDQSGFPYFYNRNNGNSMWADEYREYKNSKTQQRKSSPMAFMERSFRRAPSSFAETKSSRSLKDSNEVKALMPEIELASGKGDIAEEKVSDLIESKEARLETLSDMKESNERGAFVKDNVENDILNNGDIEDIVSDCSSSSGSTHAFDHEEDDDGNKPLTSTKLKIEAPPKDINLSPTTTPTVNSKKLVSQESFNMRLDSIQEQWTRQLQKMEATTSEIEDIKRLKASEQMLSSQLKTLQAEIEKKDAEIDNLNSHQARDCSTESELLVAKGSTNDIGVGDQDVRNEVWVASKEFDAVREKTSTREKELHDLQEKFSKLQASLGTKERHLAVMEEKQNRNVEQMKLMEDLLQKEKDAKNEAVILVEQTRAGIAGSAEIAQSLEAEKKRGDELVARLRSDIMDLELKLLEVQNETSSQLQESEQKILQQSTEVCALKKEIEDCKLSHNAYKADVTKRQREEIENLLSDHHIEKAKFDLEVQIQQEARNKSEAEKVKAFERYQEAEQRANDAESRLAQMSSMINQAKTMVAANEKLHHSLHTEIQKRKHLHNKLEDLKGRIRVYVRIRPLSKSEISMNSKGSLIKEDKRTCVMHPDNERGATKSWEFDHCFSGDSEGNTQVDVFKDTKELITSAVDGFNVCIFCYGQTGSGKTFTMFGPSGEIPQFKSINSMDDNVGLAPRAAVELFNVLEGRKASFDVSVHANMFELYNDNIRDLIACSNGNTDQTLRIKLAEHSSSGLVEVDGAVQEPVEDAIGLLDLFRTGAKSRSTASTKMNADSSRSHLLSTMVTKLVNKRTGQVTSGKVTLVDLAGSERVSKSGATGLQLKEAQSINKSLSALGDVINALTSGSRHIPYRNHPLTMLMSDSMGGNAKTLMFVCCSPASFNSPETTNSLDFAKRCKNVTNSVEGGKSRETAQVKALKAELARMKRERGGGLQRKQSGARRPGPPRK